MKKLAILFTLSVGIVMSYAQEGEKPLFPEGGAIKKGTGGAVRKMGNADDRVKGAVKKGTEVVANSGAKVEIQIENKTPTCEENHTGEVLFFNDTKKSITLEITPKDGGVDKASIILASEQSSFVNDLGVGSYKYKSPNVKKYKKTAIVNVKECAMKIVTLK